MKQNSPIQRSDGLSWAALTALYRAAGNVPHCTSCVSWLPASCNVAGRISVEMRCAKNYPGTMVCSDYKREPGADDL